MSCTRVMLLSPGLLLLVAGCGSDALKLTPVNGVVKYEGDLLKGATVTFVPKVEAAGYRIATGSTNEQGEYELMAGARRGAAGGAHYIFISAPNPESPLVQDPRISRMPQTPEAMQGASLIPLSYANAQRSGLSAEVLLGETNVFNFELTEDGTGGVVIP